MTTGTPALSTREKLLDAAAQVFLLHGFGKASMDQVRELAGVSNGSLYHHFPTKALLADALYAHTLRDFHGRLKPHIGPRVSAQDGVKGLIRAYVLWVERNPAKARVLHELRHIEGLPPGPGERADVNAQTFAQLAAWVQQHIEDGAMRPMTFAVWMAVVFAPAISLTPQWVRQAQPHVPPKVRAALEHAAWMAVAP